MKHIVLLSIRRICLILCHSAERKIATHVKLFLNLDNVRHNRWNPIGRCTNMRYKQASSSCRRNQQLSWAEDREHRNPVGFHALAGLESRLFAS